MLVGIVTAVIVLALNVLMFALCKAAGDRRDDD